MTDYNQFQDSFGTPPPPAKKMPDMLNVLTILTFIACAYEVLSSIFSYFIICKQTLQGDNEELAKTPFAKLFSSLSETMVKQCEMRVPILVTTLVCTLLCFIGALQMRKLKKSGFSLYLLGEIAAPIAMLFILGGGWTSIGGFLFPVIFIILYATQVKHLKN